MYASRAKCSLVKVFSSAHVKECPRESLNTGLPNPRRLSLVGQTTKLGHFEVFVFYSVRHQLSKNLRLIQRIYFCLIEDFCGL
jgi:hypothetical protein